MNNGGKRISSAEAPSRNNIRMNQEGLESGKIQKKCVMIRTRYHIRHHHTASSRWPSHVWSDHDLCSSGIMLQLPMDFLLSSKAILKLSLLPLCYSIWLSCFSFLWCPVCYKSWTGTTPIKLSSRHQCAYILPSSLSSDSHRSACQTLISSTPGVPPMAPLF